jgi:hypothetical protein
MEHNDTLDTQVAEETVLMWTIQSLANCLKVGLPDIEELARVGVRIGI